MGRPVEMLGSVLAPRIVAAAHVAALQAEPEVNPGHSLLEALLAAARRFGRDRVNGVEVGTLASHGPSEVSGTRLAAGPGPGDDVQPLERDRLARVLADAEAPGRPMQPVQCRVDLGELARHAGRVGGLELALHGVGAAVRKMEW